MTCAALLSRHMPVHCGDPAAWRYTEGAAVQFHVNDISALRAATAGADVVLTWECDTWLAAQREIQVPIVLVSHSTWWQPQAPGRVEHFAAVSQRAAAVFPKNTQVVLSGVSLDRVAPRRGREWQRQQWRVGPGHIVIGMIGRADPEKKYQCVIDAIDRMDYHYRGVIYGAPSESKKVRSYPAEMQLGDVYAGLDLLVVPSLRESFGQVMVEAWAAGVPTLVRERSGCVAELEQQHNTTLCFKFADDAPAALARVIEHVTTGAQSNIVTAAMALARTELSATAMAARWEDYLTRLVPPAVAVLPAKPVVAPRWRAGTRPTRVLLHCDKASLLTTTTDLGYAVSAVACEDEFDSRPACPVLSTPQGPHAWAEQYATPADGLRAYAAASDVYVALGVEPVAGLPIPCVTALADIPAAVEVEQPATRRCRVGVLISHIGYGGTEQWLATLCQDAGLAQITDIVELSEHEPSAAMLQRLRDAGATIHTAGTPEVAAQTLNSLQIDALLVCGVRQLGRYLPPNFSQPMLLVSHGPPQDHWTREWIWSSSGIATHALAVSQIAACAYPTEWHDKITVLYQGVAFPAPRQSRAQVRAELGIAPDDVIVLFVGRADNFKRPSQIVDAVAQLPARFKYVHVGRLVGQDDYVRYVQASLPGRGWMVGYSEHDVDYVNAADVLVLSSQAESVGLVLLKALACRCPVLAPAVSIIAELRTEPGWEWLPPTLSSTADAAEIAQRLLTLSAQPAITEAQAQQVRDRFDTVRAGQSFASYIERVVTAPNIRRGGWHQIAASQLTHVRSPKPAVTADAVLQLSDDATADCAEARALLDQQDCWTILHAVGTPAQIAAVTCGIPDSLCRGRLQEYPVPYGAVSLNAAVRRTMPRWQTDTVLLSPTGTRSPRDRAARTVGGIRNSDIAVATLGTEQAFCVTARAGLLLDRLLASTLPATPQDWLALPPWCITRHFAGEAQLPADFGAGVSVPLQRHTVDVVLPFRGQLAYLEPTLEGLYQQRDVRLVVHVIDDASPDREAVLQLLRRWREKQTLAFTLRSYHTQRNIGQFAAVNGVMQFCRNEFVMIQDGDDISLPQRAALSANSLALSGAGIFAAAAQGFGGWVGVVASRYPSNSPDVWREYDIVNPTVMLRRAEFLRLGGYADFGTADRNKTSLDTEFALRAIQQRTRFQISAEVLTAYRQHSASCSAAGALRIGGSTRQEVNTEIARQTLTGASAYLRGSLAKAQYLVRPDLSE